MHYLKIEIFGIDPRVKSLKVCVRWNYTFLQYHNSFNESSYATAAFQVAYV